jgi:hypothetical protein
MHHPLFFFPNKARKNIYSAGAMVWCHCSSLMRLVLSGRSATIDVSKVGGFEMDRKEHISFSVWHYAPQGIISSDLYILISLSVCCCFFDIDFFFLHQVS